MGGQQPEALPQEAVAPTSEFLQQLQMLGWVDRTALAVLLVFFVLGLFKGLIWQVSRVAILVVAYALAGRFGEAVGDFLARTPAVGGEAGPGPVDTPETTRYLAYVLVFLGVLVVLSLLTLLLQRLARQVGLGFFDRLGGGVIGIATGACVVLFGLSLVNMFFRGSELARAAEHSHSLRLSQLAIDRLGESVPDELRTVFALAPLHSPLLAPDQGTSAPGAAAPGDGPLAEPTAPTPGPGEGADAPVPVPQPAPQPPPLPRRQ